MSAVTQPHRRAALLAAAVTGVQVGAAMVATRFVATEIPPATLAMLRYAIGFLCLVPVLLTRRPAGFAPRDILPVSLLGIGQFGILIALLNWGLRIVPASRGAVIFSAFPLLTMLIAAGIRQERLTAWKAGGVLLTMFGIALALEAPLAQKPGWGDLAVLASALVGAVCSVFYRPYLRRYDTVAVGALAMAASVLALALYAIVAESLLAGVPPLPPSGWLAVLFIGASSGGGYIAWLWALRHAPATHVTVFLGLGPITALLLGALFLDEGFGAASLAGAVCVLGGLWAATRSA
jgi:drug/metabolite transporter (DMT)-like permease